MDGGETSFPLLGLLRSRTMHRPLPSHLHTSIYIKAPRGARNRHDYIVEYTKLFLVKLVKCGKMSNTETKQSRFFWTAAPEETFFPPSSHVKHQRRVGG